VAARYLSVRNFDTFQHYKDRRPPWIKLYAALWRQYDFQQLSEAARYQLISIYVLASQHENQIPWDEGWIRSEIGSKKLHLQTLVDGGFLYQSDSDVLADAIAERAHDATPTRAGGRGRTRSASVSLSVSDSDSSPGEGESEGESALEEAWTRFWDAWPRKEAKQPARKVFMRLAPQNGILEKMLAWVALAKQSEQWQDPTKIPHLATFLGQKRWENDPPPARSVPRGKQRETAEERERRNWEAFERHQREA
jgi:hypothetical protein